MQRRWGFDITVDDLMSVVVGVVFGLIIGARLFYVIFYGDGYYWAHPLEIFATNEGGMSFHGGLVGGIIGEHKLHIEHSLLCLPEDDPANIVEVNSHPVALAQCRNYLAAHPAYKVVLADDTAGAAAAISSQHLHGHAAICHADAARLYGLKVLDRAIEDNKHNYTRFLVLATQTADSPAATDADKASLVFALPHEEGSLSQVLSIFSFYRINLTKIQSLPIIGREWEYLFYIDVCYDAAERFRQSIQAVAPLTRELRVLGEYRGK